VLPVAPHIDTATAQQRAAQARVYFERPLTMRYRGRSIVLTPERMASMLSVSMGSDAGEPPLTFDNATARGALHRLFAFVEEPARDATVKISGGAVTVTRSRSGIELDMPRLLGDLDAAAADNGLRDVHVALRVVQPALTTTDVQEMGLSALGSQFSTFFDPSNSARAGNIAQAAKIVDGTIVRPGEVFSLNAALGPRTVNRGFDYAPVIAADGVLRLGVGGGICQYATTLFNAVFFAGLRVVERHAHSLYIDHYPIGRDATVAWGGPDFKFKNDTSKPLMIRSWTGNDVLTVVLVGKTGRSVSFTTSPFYDVRSPRTSKDHPRVVYDGDLSAGIVRWEKGWAGRSVKVVRTVRQSGAVLFTDTFVSVYQPADWIKRIGTR
jgi:vancomycin resistance protein YoaR